MNAETKKNKQKEHDIKTTGRGGGMGGAAIKTTGQAGEWAGEWAGNGRQIMSSKDWDIVYLTCAWGTLRSLTKAQFMIRRNTSFSQHRCAFASNLRRRLHMSHVLRLESKMATEVKSEGRDTRGCRPKFVRNQSLISTRFARPRHGADIPGKQCEAGSGPWH